MLPAVMDSHAPSGNFTHRCNSLTNWGIFSIFQINHPSTVSLLVPCLLDSKQLSITPLQVAGSYYASPVSAWSRIRGLFLHLWCALLEGA